MTRNILFIFLITPLIFFAQSGTIRGFVYEKQSEEPIIFANIILEGTDLGVVSDDNGYFIIPNVPYFWSCSLIMCSSICQIIILIYIKTISNFFL